MSEEENKILKNTRLLQKYTYYYKRFKDAQQGIEFSKKLSKGIEGARVVIHCVLLLMKGLRDDHREVPA